jgi:prolyl oligopeptidase
MTRLVADALFGLVRTEWLLYRRGLPALQNALRRLPSSTRNSRRWTSEQICQAVDVACVLYFKRVLCLQRSGATTMLLRSYGFPADLVIGARIVPFRSHAWVEINRIVVNDKSYIPGVYRELERCCPPVACGQAV